MLDTLRFYVWQIVSSVTVTPRRRRLQELREQWGKGGSKEPWLAGRYFELVAARKDRSTYVDGRTWNDLEFPRIFADMDTTVTRPGCDGSGGEFRGTPPERVPDPAIRGRRRVIRRQASIGTSSILAECPCARASSSSHVSIGASSASAKATYTAS